MKKASLLILLSCILLAVSAGLPLYATAEPAKDCTTVRVGYFDFDGYHNRSKEGEKSGYGYEYLQELRKYTNWEYEYVYAPYEECLQLLKEGKIDLLTSVSYSKDQEEFFDYSALPLGTKNAILTVKNSNTTCIPGEYDTFNRIHVGMLKDNTDKAMLSAFSQKHDFTCTYEDRFSDLKELHQALLDGKVNAIITSNLRKLQDERIIAEFTPSPYYAIVKKGNETLLNQLNMAMEKISILTPTYQALLYQKYYGENSVGGLAFSPQELAYIKEHPRLSILIPPSLPPMAYSENGIVKGIEPDLIRKALEPSGLKLDLITFDSSEEYLRATKDTRKYPVIGLAYNNAYQAELNHIRLTAPYLSISYNVIAKTNMPHKNLVVAAVKKEPLVLNYVNTHYKPDQIRYYDNGEACIQAVLQGEATHTIMNSYIAEAIIENDVTHRLINNTIMGFHSDFSISVQNDADDLLFSVLNKCVNALSQDDTRSILVENTLFKNSTLSLLDYLYLYPLRVILGVIFFFVVITSVIIVTVRQQQLKKEQRAFEETARFARIATDANGKITEVNLRDHLVISYSFLNNKLIKTQNPISSLLYDEKIRFELINPEDLAEYTAMFSKENLLTITGTDLQKNYTFRIKGTDGNYHWTFFTLLGISCDSTHPQNLMIFQKNIDDLKRKEALRTQQLTDALNTAMAASTAKGTFMSRMSHEIRTPLNAVIGYMTLAKSTTKSTEKVSDCLTKAEAAAKHLLCIINDVLDMSSIESGKLKISQTRFDFKELIADLSAMFYMQAQSKNIRFEVILKDVTQDFLMGDRLRVNQILLNLLSNAVKFTPSGGTIYFTVEQTAVKNNKVFMKFIVADSGIGMSAKYKDKLFTPFEQQDASIAQIYGGTGLGLSITKNLITMMNGIIHVSSEQNKGSTFTVDLPFELDHTPAKPEEPKETYGFTGQRLLLAEDNEMNREIAVDLLSEYGFVIDCATNGKEALDAFEKSKIGTYNCILMDIQMPVMNGYAATKAIRESLHPEAATIPIIAMTANAFTEDIAASHSAGMNDHISKPIDVEQLLSTLKKQIH